MILLGHIFLFHNSRSGTVVVARSVVGSRGANDVAVETTVFVSVVNCQLSFAYLVSVPV